MFFIASYLGYKLANQTPRKNHGMSADPHFQRWNQVTDFEVVGVCTSSELTPDWRV